MSSSLCCRVCGSALPDEAADSAVFCLSCGMRCLPGGEPVFSPLELHAALQGGDDGLSELAGRVGMPVENIRRVVELFQRMADSGPAADGGISSADLDDSGAPATEAGDGRSACVNASADPRLDDHPSAARGMTVDDGTPGPSTANRAACSGEAAAGVSPVVYERPDPARELRQARDEPGLDEAPGKGRFSGEVRHGRIGDTSRSSDSGVDGTHREVEPRPRLYFAYDDAFYLGQAGIVRLKLDFEVARGDEQDIKLTLEGDLARPFNMNWQDLLGREKEIVLTPTSFPTSRVVFRLSCFDSLGEPHCWIGESTIADVEKPVEDGAKPNVIISSTFQTGDGKHIGDSSAEQNINLDGLDTSMTMKRRRLDQPRRCEVFLRPDDQAEHRLKQSAGKFRIEAQEIFARAQNRVRKGKLEKAYELIREVEERGFFLHEAQALRSQIERDLSELSYRQGRRLFEQGRLKEAYELLQERKLLVFNQAIIDLLIDIEDIDEACTSAAAALERGEFDEAEELAGNVLEMCARYERAATLLERARTEKRRREKMLQAEDEKRRARERDEVRRKIEAERRARVLADLEGRLRRAVDLAQWEDGFAAVAEYMCTEGHDPEAAGSFLDAYVEATGLEPLAKFIPPAEDEDGKSLPPLPELLVLAKTDIPVGRAKDCAIVLDDSTRRTGRHHGRIFLAEPGKWVIRRDRSDSNVVHRVTVNGEPLDEDEAVEILDGDVLDFAGIVKLKARVPSVDGDGSSPGAVELRTIELPPEDAEYLDTVRWLLMEREILVGGGDNCHLRLPLLEKPAFRLKLLRDVFWIAPPGGQDCETVLVEGEPLVAPRPLLYKHTLVVGRQEYLFYHLRSNDELLLWEDELDERSFEG